MTLDPGNRPTPLAKPSLEYLKSLRSELERLYGEQDAQLDRTRDVRDLRARVPIPDQFRIVDVEVRDPTVADETQHVVATLTVNRPKLRVKPSKPTDRAQQNATLRENFTEQLLEICGGRMAGQLHTFEAIVDGIAGDGGCWTKFVFARDLWDVRYSRHPDQFDDDTDLVPDEATGRKKRVVTRSKYKKFDDTTEDDKKAAGPPFIWSSLDARTVYPVWTATGLREVLEVTERPEHTTFRQYRLKRDKRGNIVDETTPEELGQGTSRRELRSSGEGVVECYEHWDDTWVSFAIVSKNAKGTPTGKVVKQWEHGLGQVPYFCAMLNLRAYSRNRKVGYSISETKRWLVEYRSFLWTMHANVTARDSMPPLFREVPADSAPIMGEDGQVKASEVWEPRQIINGRPGEKITPTTFPDVAQSLTQQIALVDAAIEKLSTPQVDSNIGGGLEGAGFAINQILAEARLRFSPLCLALQRMLVEITRFAWKLIREKVGEDVWVYYSGDGKDGGGWLKAGGVDLSDAVHLEWEIDPELPSAKLIEERYWAERVQNGSAGLDQMIEALGDSPDEVRLARALDRMRQSPWYQKFQDQTVLQSLGKGDLLAQAALAANVAATGQFPTSGPPPGPGAMGNSVVPDLGGLAAAPNGAGAAPAPGGGVGGGSAFGGVGPGPAAGAPMVPTNSAIPGAQGLVG